MKKIILASVLAASAATAVSSANAAAVSGAACPALAVAGSGTAVATNAATDANFVKTGFTPKCSANTHVTYEDGGSFFRVGSGSTKGKTKFGGSSAGGGVVSAGTCASATG